MSLKKLVLQALALLHYVYGAKKAERCFDKRYKKEQIKNHFFPINIQRLRSEMTNVLVLCNSKRIRHVTTHDFARFFYYFADWPVARFVLRQLLLRLKSAFIIFKRFGVTSLLFRLVTNYFVKPHCFNVFHFAECEDLIRSLLSYRPADRPSLEKIMVHPWILKGDFISR